MGLLSLVAWQIMWHPDLGEHSDWVLSGQLPLNGQRPLQIGNIQCWRGCVYGEWRCGFSIIRLFTYYLFLHKPYTSVVLNQE